MTPTLDQPVPTFTDVIVDVHADASFTSIEQAADDAMWDVLTSDFAGDVT